MRCVGRASKPRRRHACNKGHPWQRATATCTGSPVRNKLRGINGVTAISVPGRTSRSACFVSRNARPHVERVRFQDAACSQGRGRTTRSLHAWYEGGSNDVTTVNSVCQFACAPDWSYKKHTLRKQEAIATQSHISVKEPLVDFLRMADSFFEARLILRLTETSLRRRHSAVRMRHAIDASLARICDSAVMPSCKRHGNGWHQLAPHSIICRRSERENITYW